MFSPETQSRISNLRLKAVAGTVTAEEMKEAIHLLRQGRASAVAASSAARAKGAKKTVDVGALFDDLDKL